MKDRDFQELVDREFASLTWTDRQRMDTLRKMNKEVRPIMKRKLITVTIAALLLLTLTGTAVAAGLNITSLKEFFERYTATWSKYGYETPVLNENKIAHPEGYRHTSDLLNVTVDQIYETNEALYFTVQYTPRDPNTLLFDGAHSSITLDGEEKRYWHLWDHEELSLLSVNGMQLDDLNGSDPLLNIYFSDSTRDPDTGAITHLYVFKHPERLNDHIRVSGAHTIMLRFEVSNLRNHDVEWNVLFLDLPEMEIENTAPVNTN